MQKNIDEMQLCCSDPDMSLNKEKVHVMYFGLSNVHHEYYLDESLTLPIKKVQEEKDLGVLISEDLKPSKMVTRQAQRAHEKLKHLQRRELPEPLPGHHQDKPPLLYHNLEPTNLRELPHPLLAVILLALSPACY